MAVVVVVDVVVAGDVEVVAGAAARLGGVSS